MSEETTSRPVLTLDQIVALPGTVERQVPIPALGGEIIIRNLTNLELKDINKRATNIVTGKIDADRVESLMLCWGCVSPRFNPDTYKMLCEKNAGAVVQIVAAILEASGLSQSAMDEARAAFRE